MQTLWQFSGLVVQSKHGSQMVKTCWEAEGPVTMATLKFCGYHYWLYHSFQLSYCNLKDDSI